MMRYSPPRTWPLWALVIGLATWSASRAHAEVILSPVSVFNNTMGNFDADHTTANLINQSGLSFGFTSGVTDFDVYIGGGPTSLDSFLSNSSWTSVQGQITGSMGFDLGSSFTIGRVAIWNVRTGADRGTGGPFAINSITLEIDDNALFSSPALLGNLIVPQAGTQDLVPAQVFALTPGTGQFIRLTINSNHGDPDFTIFGEIAFSTAPTSAPPGSSEVPEPLSLALWGFGAVAIAVQRRRGRAK